MALKSYDITIDNLIFHFLKKEGTSKQLPLLFLHGFTGSCYDWTDIIESVPKEFTCFAIDLIGHGRTSKPSNENQYTTETQTVLLKEFIEKEIKFPPVLIGYSMGGRLALQFAVRHPSLAKGLIAESTTGGIESKTERLKRIDADAKLIELIEKNGVANFINYWLNLPIFSTMNNLHREKYDSVKMNKLKNDAEGLINSLKGFGAGIMPPIWNKLESIVFPVLILHGEFDEKYKAIALKLHSRINGSLINEVKGAGHNTHLEKPGDFINFVVQFCNRLRERTI